MEAKKPHLIKLFENPYPMTAGIGRIEDYDDGTRSTLVIWAGRPDYWRHLGDPERIIARLSRR